MKKVISIIVLATIIISLTACGAAKPEDTVSKYFLAVQKFNTEEMATCILPSNADETTSELIDMQNDDEYTKYFLDYMKTNASKLTFKVTGSEVNGEKAVVTVDCRYVDGSLLIKTVIGEYFTKSMGLAFSGTELSDEEIGQMLTSIMKDQITKIDEVYKDVTLKINCVLKEKVWYIEEVSGEMSNVFSSGFEAAFKDIGDSANGTQETTTSDNPSDVLREIDSYVTGDLWNDGFCEISWYLSEGTGSTGQKIDIDFTKSQLDKAMEKKAGYDTYIKALDNNYTDVKEVWAKLSAQIDLLYQQVKSGASSLDTGLFTQYDSAFSDLVNDW